MEDGRSFTLSDLARRLEVPQYQLIHLCEKDVVVPDLQDAHGRGSSRVFSARNFLELAVAVRLRSAMLPVAAVSAVLHLLRAFADRLHGELIGFSLPDSLREGNAPDLRIIVSDGRAIYFSLAGADGESKLFGGILLDQLVGKPPTVGPARSAPTSVERKDAAPGEFGGPEGSRFVRLELSVTEVARSLALD